MTAAATRTSPVLRGKYIISNLMNTPPLPPPAVVPDLEESAHKDRPSTVREQLERHRANPTCGVVPPQHRSGRLRAREFRRRRAVARRDARRAGHRHRRRPRRRHQGRRPGRPARGAAGAAGRLRRHGHREAADLRARPRPRAGRHAGRPGHRPRAAARNYAMQSIVLGIVRSAPFQMRTKLTRLPPAPTATRH